MSKVIFRSEVNLDGHFHQSRTMVDGRLSRFKKFWAWNWTAQKIKSWELTHGTLDWRTPLGRHKVVQIHFWTKNGPLEVIEDQILKKNYGPKSADRTADFGKISFFQFLTYVANLRCTGRYTAIDDIQQSIEMIGYLCTKGVPANEINQKPVSFERRIPE